MPSINAQHNSRPSLEGNSQSSRIGFLSLPRELRDDIYTLCLTAPSPIVVWSGWYRKFGTDEETDSRNGGTPPGQKIVGVTKYKLIGFNWHDKPGARGIVLNLLHCQNTTIAREAAKIFYSTNNFLFHGHPTWECVTSWLEQIGPRNRNFLTKLDIERSWGKHFRQRDVHVVPQGRHRNIVFETTRSSRGPPGPLAHNPRFLLERGEPIEDILDLSLEDMFRYLSRDREGTKITLLLLVPQPDFHQDAADHLLSTSQKYSLVECVMVKRPGLEIS